MPVSTTPRGIQETSTWQGDRTRRYPQLGSGKNCTAQASLATRRFQQLSLSKHIPNAMERAQTRAPPQGPWEASNRLIQLQTAVHARLGRQATRASHTDQT